jgi:alpha-ketoglutarate-dependent taurine dioxygenase
LGVAFEPIKPHIGARVHVERSQLLTKETAQACFDKLEDRTVLVFPRINLTDREQLAFTDLMGERINFNRKVPGANASAQDVYKVTLDKKLNPQPEYVLGTFFWHMDGVTVDTPPPKATLLSARKLSNKGGQTEFASTFAAFEGLPVEEQAELEQLRAVHSVRRSLAPLIDALTEEERSKLVVGSINTHPIVWTHKSGKKSMVIGSHADYVVDMPLAHGRALLARLVEWAAQPAYSYRHQWEVGDFVIWDNTGALHRVVPYDAESGRTMHRTSLAGTEKVG